jgi:hypothetical protein
VTGYLTSLAGKKSPKSGQPTFVSGDFAELQDIRCGNTVKELPGEVSSTRRFAWSRKLAGRVRRAWT